MLDIETDISDFAVAIVEPQNPDIRRAALQELVGASILLFQVGPDTTCSDWQLMSVDRELDEAAMLCRLNDVLAPVYASGGTLVTFNGAHDLSVLIRRSSRHWLFDKFRFDQWEPSGSARHLDMMRLDPAGQTGRWPSLVDAAAGYGINAACNAATGKSLLTFKAARKSQVDVVATTLLYFHHAARVAGSIAPLAHGWESLACWLAQTYPRHDHLSNFWQHPFVKSAKRYSALS